MSDIVERLREGCGCNFPETTCMAESECADAFAAADEITALRAEVERLRADLRNAVMSDTEYCAELERINKALIDAPTVDVDVMVPERDYSAMTPRDCYEAGLLDGVYQARVAIKAAVREALGGKDE